MKFLKSSCIQEGDIRNHVANNDIFKKGLSTKSSNTIFDFRIAEISEENAKKYSKIHIDRLLYENQSLLDIYSIWCNFNKLRNLESDSNYLSLIKYLSEKSPDEIKNLYHIDGLVLPFIEPKKHIIFPLTIDADIHVINNKHKDSLLEQRKIFNAKLYNGYTYRLLSHNQETGQLKLALCRYFDTLDSADYLSSRLKVYYQQYLQDGEESQDLLTIVAEWRNRTKGVALGDFSSYNSGFGFSLPIFRILDNGGLELLYAKSSSQKAIWAQKKQICPSGTLEYWSEWHSKELSFEDFKTIAIKELFEENLLGDRKICKNILNEFPNLKHSLDCFLDRGEASEVCVSFDMIRASCKTIVNLWDKIFEKIETKKPSLEPLQKIEEAEDVNQLFVIIDAFNHRPEIVFPLYINDELNKIFNWEYNNSELDLITWNDVQDLNNWVKNHYQEWSTPSLAAAYLGAKKYFEKTND